MKTLRLIGTVVMAVMMSVNFVACDDDDDDKDPVTPPVETPSTGGSNNNDDSGSLQECSWCDGSGDCQGDHCDGGYCSSCDGTGYEYDSYTDYKMDCPWCDRGKCPSCKGRNKCTKCNGKGYIK